MPISAINLIGTDRQWCKASYGAEFTGNSDRRTADDAIETGKTFQFINKPCSQAHLVAAIESGMLLLTLQSKIEDIQNFVRKEA